MMKEERKKTLDSNTQMSGSSFSRRSFITSVGLAGAAAIALQSGCGTIKTAKNIADPDIPGFEDHGIDDNPYQGWKPVSDRKIRVGLVGYGASRFSAAFGFQQHPNVEIVAVSDLIPERCAALAKHVGCNKTYPSLEELVKDDTIEAVFVATDAPGHVRHCIEVLNHGKHVAVAVPATYGSLEEADRMLEAVKKNRGLKYMMMETSCFRADLYAMRQIYKAGGFGQIVYSEGEYYTGQPLEPGKNKTTPSFNNWRGGPPLWYPTHGTAYHIGVTDGSFTEVSCLGVLADSPRNALYKNNPYSSEIALFRTSEGGISRQARSAATPGNSSETGRVRGTLGSYGYGEGYIGRMKDLPNLKRPPLPPGMTPGGHGGSHAHLTNEFILSILEDRKPVVDIISALNMTVPGIIAHESALKGGETLKIPQYTL